MRPLRLLLSLSTTLLAVTLLLYATLGTRHDQHLERVPVPQHGRIKTFFSFTSPNSLFPPSAIISLTDDNSTFFLARPADFGPPLPNEGLSSPLWVGSGFGDDIMSIGELGCSDIPGWDGSSSRLVNVPKPAIRSRNDAKGSLDEQKNALRERSVRGHVADRSKSATQLDGTDNHLHLPFQDPRKAAHDKEQAQDHADMQLLQEIAEITGKVVLLRRGGCGFLAKVEWAQKRGGVAVIVGDDVRGGALIRMYAKGDTSNVTIPSLFTSHTTAHLLSSLLPSNPILGSLPPADNYRPSSPSDKNAPQDDERIDSQIFNTTTSTPAPNEGMGSQHMTNDPTSADLEEQGWFRSLLSLFGIGNKDQTTRTSSQRPPSSGTLDWVQAEDWDNEQTHVRTTSAESALTRAAAVTPVLKRAGRRSVTSITGANINQVKSPGGAEPHEGLWVTLTPTNVSTSPFFDTLLVLVVSPLVTLTVVYALLLLRSRIRRRRWRAPKSVVERLPVRTYHTISDSSSSSSSPSTASDSATLTTPLLQRSSTQPTSSLPRPRSQTESDLPATSSSTQHSPRNREEEKRETGLAEWRRRYGGRQRECVVCLDEYEDGVSQVMSLPCGHEFHAECITPWLVTRRRTCPICKGDVVRSLSQSYHDRLRSSSPTRSARHLEDVDDIQTQAIETRNDSPSASRPVPVSDSAPAAYSDRRNDDVEANWSEGDTQASTQDTSGGRVAEVSSSVRDLSSTVSTVIWRGVEVVRNSTGLQRRAPGDVDRDR